MASKSSATTTANTSAPSTAASSTPSTKHISSPSTTTKSSAQTSTTVSSNSSLEAGTTLGPSKKPSSSASSAEALLDLGTGAGNWAIDIADEFPRVEVIAVDLAPIQPRKVPPNCTFELCDIDQWPIPYPDAHFDVIHARSIHIGIRNYPRFLREVARLLRPGGLVLLVEPTLNPCPPPAPQTPMPGWAALWETYRACLTRQHIDVTVPERLSSLLAATAAFENIIVRDGNVPVGFWPQGLVYFYHDQLSPLKS
ncbi:unnamed protein product [Cyclocybe aegerita]|uniref:S-adenosyl-L-methionine-dependent methyltransferase n=1 Tax=Cyclocybe aegerita TaxID=1973307 RepID=A0A8S0X9R1_CYCAE|nr:unnamed protein product [Cyclocybe aegerita]